MPYVVTEGRKVPESGGAPESIRGVYEDWASCFAAITGSTDTRYMKVCSREDAYAILADKGVVLPPGLYAFTDGNSSGGVGVAIVRMGDGQNAEPQVEQRIPRRASDRPPFTVAVCFDVVEEITKMVGRERMDRRQLLRRDRCCKRLRSST